MPFWNKERRSTWLPRVLKMSQQRLVHSACTVQHVKNIRFLLIWTKGRCSCIGQPMDGSCGSCDHVGRKDICDWVDPSTILIGCLKNSRFLHLAVNIQLFSSQRLFQWSQHDVFHDAHDLVFRNFFFQKFLFSFFQKNVFDSF